MTRGCTAPQKRDTVGLAALASFAAVVVIAFISIVVLMVSNQAEPAPAWLEHKATRPVAVPSVK